MIYYWAARKSNAQSRITFHLYRKNTNWGREQEPLRVPSWPPFNGANFESRGRVISCRLANRVGSRFETNRKLLPEIIGPISTPNDYLNTSSDEVVSLRGSCRNNACPPMVPTEKAQVFVSVKSFLLIQERRKEYAICWSPRQIEIYPQG